MRTDRSRVQVRKVLTYVRVRDKLRNQPRLKDYQAHRNSKGSKQPKARKTGPPPHCLSLDASGATCLDLQSELSTRVLEVRGGGLKVNPETRHCKSPRQEGPNLRPGEGKVKEPSRT